MLLLSGTTGYSDKNPSIVARSRLSRAPTMSSIAVTCEIAHESAKPSTYLIAAALPRETSIRTLLSIRKGTGSLRVGLGISGGVRGEGGLRIRRCRPCLHDPST